MADVLYISYDGLSDPLGSSQVIPYLMVLSGKGHRIHVLSLEKRLRFEKYGSGLKEMLASQNISWTYCFYADAWPLLSQRKNIRSLQRQAMKIMDKEKPAIVHCRSYIAALIGLKLKKKYGAKFLFDMRGFWPEERVEGKIWNPRNPAYRFLFRYFKKKEIEFIREADHIVTLTKAAEEDLRLRKTTPAIVNISVIPCCADEQLFKEENVSADEKNRWRKKLGLEKENMTMTYLGSLGTWYMLNEMLDLFKELLQKYPSAKFLFITTDPSERIYRLCDEKAIDRDKIITVSASRREVPPLLSICTFSIYFIRPTYSKKASSPTKTAEILLMGRPVLTNSGIGDSDEQIRSANCGVIVEEMAPNAYREAIEELIPLLSLPSQHFRDAAERLFSLQKGAEEYHRIYKGLLK